ncbi:hypothetical protein [Paludisphaera mucosa]|uniref:Uncharacterized protein n=1 Tax=Paludisphaera mucosa TaxID=3030827 RepID=A0ABT6F7Y6_9BACT|nr:hypothetical protein [Paludisphaera mucosa]MDG3003702.1 hypothetical protein [Paludisphaera mucosa]
MSSSPAVPSASRDGAAPPAGRFNNPSYPARTHFGERPALEARLKSCDDRLGAVRRKLALLTNHSRRPEYEKLVIQMQGARDQLAEAVYRIPREAAGLYHEDRERLEVAERSFAWLLRRWESISS